ncbi:strawberry notch-like NTP hydrolase domain-containing protein [Sphingobium chlorophenolicum]|uniref:Putative methylase/helicase n=1 Tax=Sphingobium chlorophenolicum TaxID=46429 RepID=A0A081REZ6_SPHCR|nr:strawberry notch family protein [Sphingobium chlorophenolicum]KEQ53769.1 putative methylase/helicase [Sphingobium chlorophenolicum]
MSDLFEMAAGADREAVRLLLSHLQANDVILRRHLNQAMTAAFGGSDADGRWTQRASFEILEHALAIHLQASASKPAAFSDVRALIELSNRLPTQTVRSEDQIEWQQFSTPVDIAAVMTLLANVQSDDIVLEPSAGNGLLVAQLGQVEALHLNELDPLRRGRLKAAFPSASITGHDGATINSTLASVDRPTLILMNPPFSRSVGRGTDDYAAVRHLQAALRRLQPGGRLVAIMPDWFGPSARMREQYETILRDVSVLTAVRLEKCYLKHGTSIAVRLFVIDKVPGKSPPSLIQRSSVSDLLDILVVPGRSSAKPDRGASVPKRSGGVSLFRAVKSSRPAPRAYHAPARNHVLPVAYAKLETPAPLLEQSGVYLPYRPSRISFASAGEHPTPLVESVAMGSIPAPIPDYVPALPERTVAERLLSASQLETVVYAGHAWTQWIPGNFKPDKEGVGLVLAEDGQSYRKGFFLGDGTGAGKGRQIAACILDNWLQGRRRNIWVSKNAPLLEDARRDWTALGGLNGDIQSISDWKIDEPLNLDQGVLFISYPTLRSMRGDHSRLKQIVDWAGADFDGVIAFDEAHEMGGVAGGEGALGTKDGSQQGICGVLLQNHLPAARVLYASATGASVVNNLAYAVRLGLWGPGTAFPDREQFISSISKGGIAAMELVARDLKATGLYMARALSFAGVEYDILRHELTSAQIEIYDTYADAWSIIHQNMEKALELTGVVDALKNATLNSAAKASARSRFESTKQRFFGQVLLSMKLPTVIAAVREHLAADQSVVLQLVTTAESILDRRLGALSPDERADLEIDLSPREYMIDYLERAFPTRQMQVFTDDTGAQRSVPMEDDAGNPVYNPEAEAARAQLIEHLCALPPIMSALDGILEHFGHDNVAEVTGRTKRLVSTADGRQKLESRSTRTSQAEAAAFMQGRKRILVFSDAGGTGRSYHASRDVPNQQQRVHLLLEPGWRADRAIQGLGRTHRTHQASTPLFRPVTTDCKGELRFTSTIARRLDSLGALTRGQRQTGGQNLFDPADNLESEYACAALVSWFHLLVGGKLTSVSHAEFEKRTGLELCDKDGVMKEDLPPIQRWLNRILALPIALQNKIFDEFLALVETRVSAAREAGRLDVGVETILVDTATLIDDTLLRTDPVSGATSHLLTIEIARRRTPVSLERVLRIADNDGTADYLMNAKSGMVALQTRARALMEEKEGTPIPRFELIRPTRPEYMREQELFESAWAPIDRERFSTKWLEEAHDAASKVDTETIRLATGLLLPIWSALPSDHLVVNRIADKDGNSWLGRLVFDDHVVQLFTKLGLDRADTLPPTDLVKSALAGRSVDLTRPFHMTIKRALVNGSPRIELVGAPPAQLVWLKSIGCFTEVIQYRTRVFVPVPTAAEIVGRIVTGAP